MAGSVSVVHHGGESDDSAILISGGFIWGGGSSRRGLKEAGQSGFAVINFLGVNPTADQSVAGTN